MVTKKEKNVKCNLTYTSSGLNVDTSREVYKMYELNIKVNCKNMCHYGAPILGADA